MDSFSRLDKKDFMSSKYTNEQRLKYLESWYDFVVKKAKSCTTALGECTGGVSKVEKSDDNTVQVTYHEGKKENCKEVKCSVKPTDNVNYGIREILSDKPPSGNDQVAGRTYTIKYGVNKELRLTLSRGPTGTDGAMGDGWGTFDRYRRKLINPGVTGFSASGNGISASVTGAKGGVTGFSLSLCGASFVLGGLYRGHNGIACDYKATGTDCHVNKYEAVLSEVRNTLSDFETLVGNEEDSQLNNETAALSNSVAALKTIVNGLPMDLRNIALNNNM